MKINIRLFLGSIFFQHLSYGILIPVLIIWMRQQGLSFSEIALIQSAGLLIIFLSEIPTSLIADRSKSSYAIISGLCSIFLGLAVLTFATSFIQFMLFQLLFSLGLAVLSGTEEKLLHELLPKNNNSLTKSFGWMSITDEAGTISGMLVSSFCIKYLNIIISFYAALACIAISLLLILFVRIFTRIISKEAFSKPDEDGVKGFYSVPKNISFTLLILLALLAERGEILFQGTFFQLGLNIESFGIVYAIGKLFSILGSYSAHFIETKIGSFFSLVATAMLQVAAFILLLIPYNLVAIGAIGLFFFAENIMRNVRSSLVIKSSPENRQATNLSLVNFSASSFLIISQLIIGYAMDIKFIYAILFIVSIKIFTSIGITLWQTIPMRTATL